MGFSRGAGGEGVEPRQAGDRPRISEPGGEGLRPDPWVLVLSSERYHLPTLGQPHQLSVPAPSPKGVPTGRLPAQTRAGRPPGGVASQAMVQAETPTGFPDGSVSVKKRYAGFTGDDGSSPGSEEPLEEGTATHCSILARRIPWAEEPGGLQSRGSQSPA